MLEFAKENEQDVSILPAVLPWWENSEIKDELDEDEDELEYADEPDSVSDQVIMGITPPEGVGRRLVYNALAIWYVQVRISYSQQD